MIDDNQVAVAKMVGAMDAHSCGSVDWYLCPGVLSCQLLTDSLVLASSSEARQRVVEEVFLEFGQLLDCSFADFERVVA